MNSALNLCDLNKIRQFTCMLYCVNKIHILNPIQSMCVKIPLYNYVELSIFKLQNKS